MPPDLLQRLRTLLRRDPSDGQIAFLLSLAVREPFIVYGSERARLRRLLSARARSPREVLMAEAAEQLLEKSATPSRGLRRPESGPTDVGGPLGDGPALHGGESDLPAPKPPRERETEPAPKKKKKR